MSKTILIVDDSDSLREVVGIALKGAGYEVIEGADGQEGLNQLDGKKIHLIISDVNMPNMNGIDMVKKIKEMPEYKFTPIIMLTTESGEDMKDQGRSAGVKAWMVKPFKPEQMLDAVSKLIMP
ncbi:MAG: response regulator [Gammaproteobacteria bacterium]|nr:response regulator [Gammaproteobacteria bacterium]MDH5651428.1 response regulator [Gammaproteobacteria bacterium]